MNFPGQTGRLRRGDRLDQARIVIPDIADARADRPADHALGRGGAQQRLESRQVGRFHATGLTPNATPYWMTGGSGAEVEVDTETGHVRVLRLVNVADAGTPINPRIVETQLTGAAVMQLGFTMSEEMAFTDGQLRNPSFAPHKIPGIRDMPEFLTGESVAARQESGPYGAKGVGETGTFGG